MSDEFQDAGFLDSFSDEPGAENASVGQDAAPAEPSQDYSQILAENQQLKAEREAQRKWRDDVVQVLSGQNPQQNQGLDPQAVLQQFVQNPLAWKQEVASQAAQQAVQIAQQNITAQMAIQEAEQKYPHLAPFKPYIGLEADLVEQEWAQQGKPLNPREVLNEAINRFNQKSQGLLTQQQTQQQVQQAQNMGRRLDVTGTQQQTQKVDLFSLSDAEFAKYREQVRRKLSST